MTLQRIPVSELDENTDVSPDAVVHVVQDGVSKKAGVGNLVGIGVDILAKYNCCGH